MHAAVTPLHQPWPEILDENGLLRIENDEEPEPTRYLSDEFYDTRPRLQHISRAARAARVPRDAVLGACLARISYLTPPNIMLPDIIGTPASLNFIAVLLAGSGGGKSVAIELAKMLLPDSAGLETYRRREVTNGSGEGMAAAFCDHVTVKNEETNRQTTQLTRVYDGVMQVVDEGEELTKLGQRSGSTAGTQLRKAATGGALGFFNAREQRPIIDTKSYRYVMQCALQPGVAGPLLEDSTGGTPQRFVWSAGTDPLARDQARPAAPGPLNWKPPEGHNADNVRTCFGGEKWIMGCDPRIAEKLIADHEDRYTRDLIDTLNDDNLDGHRGLNTLKVAGLLALLDGRLYISEEDWALASDLIAVSDNVRDVVNIAQARQAQAITQRKTDQQVRTTVASEEAKARSAEDGIDGAAQAMVRRLQRVEEPQSLAQLKDFCNKHKPYAKQAMGRLIEDGIVELVQDGRRERYVLA